MPGDDEEGARQPAPRRRAVPGPGNHQTAIQTLNAPAVRIGAGRC
eukprot:gene5333-9437_t